MDNLATNTSKTQGNVEMQSELTSSSSLDSPSSRPSSSISSVPFLSSRDAVKRRERVATRVGELLPLNENRSHASGPPNRCGILVHRVRSPLFSRMAKGLGVRVIFDTIAS